MSNTEFANKQESKTFLAGLIKQPNSRDTSKITETDAQIIAETNTRGAVLHKIKSATRQEMRDFEIGLKHRIIRGTTKMTLGETATSFVDKSIIEAPELGSDMLKWIYHNQMRGMLEIEQWDTLVDETFRHNPRIFLATVMSGLHMRYLWELIRFMNESDLHVPLKLQRLDDNDLPLAEDHKASENYKPKDGSDGLAKFLQDQYLVLASVVKRGEYSLEVHDQTPIRFTREKKDDRMKWHGIDDDNKVEQEAEAAYEVDIHEDFLEGFGSRRCFAMSVFAKDPYPVNIPNDFHLLAGFWCEKKYHLLTKIPGTSGYSSGGTDCEV